MGWTILVVLASRPATAQAREGDVRPEGIQLGPVVLAPGVELRPFGLDTNILRDPVDQKRDMIGSVASHLTATVRMRPIEVETSNAVEFEYFAHYSDQRSVNRDHWLRVRTRLARATLFASGGAFDTRERVDFDLDSRVRRTGTATALGAELRLTPKTSVATRVSRGYSTYEGDASVDGIPIQRTLQNRVDRADASLRMMVTPLTTIFMEADASRTRFIFSPARDSNSVRLIPGFETSSTLMSGRVAIGYQRFESLNNSFPDFSGVVGDVDMTFPLGSATRFQVGVRRDLAYSYHPTDLLYVVGAIQGSIVHRIGGRLELRAAASRYRLSYRSLIAAAGGAIDEYSIHQGRVEHGRTFRSAIGFRVRRLIRVGVEAEYINRYSPRPNRHFNEMRASLFLRFGFPRREAVGWSLPT